MGDKYCFSFAAFVFEVSDQLRTAVQDREPWLDAV
jgi:hypothetical protein